MHFLHPCIELGIHDTFSEAGRDLAKSEPTKTKHADVLHEESKWKVDKLHKVL